jgi:hypothetical protein
MLGPYARYCNLATGRIPKCFPNFDIRRTLMATVAEQPQASSAGNARIGMNRNQVKAKQRTSQERSQEKVAQVTGSTRHGLPKSGHRA